MNSMAPMSTYCTKYCVGTTIINIYQKESPYKFPFGKTTSNWKIPHYSQKRGMERVYPYGKSITTW